MRLVGAPPRAARLLRDRSGGQRVTNIELFFDLVYVFAVTQLSHYLLGHPTVPGALQAGLLLAMVWTVWAYTTWVTNWLDPEQLAVRLLLMVLMLVSLAMSAALPRAFGDLGLAVGAAYAIQQIGRSGFVVLALRGYPLQSKLPAHPGLVRGVQRARGGRRPRARRRRGTRCGWRRSGWTCSAAWSVSTPPGWGGPAPRTGPSRAATSPSAARRSS